MTPRKPKPTPEPILPSVPVGQLVITGAHIRPIIGIAQEDGEIAPINVMGQDYGLEQAKAFFEVEWPIMFAALKDQHAGLLAQQETEKSRNNRASRRAAPKPSNVTPIKATPRKATAKRKPATRRR